MDPNDVPLVAKLMDGNLCLSGGAAGADALWGEEASKIGHQVIHWSFKGHKSHGDPAHTIQLDDELLKEADIRLEMANLTLRRRLNPYKPWIMNLLRRNWYQVQFAEAIYMVGKLGPLAAKHPSVTEYADIKRKSTGPLNYMDVQGGTAWASQMYLDRYTELDKNSSVFENVYGTFSIIMFNQEDNQSYSYDPERHFWIPIDVNMILPPKGIYAAVGTRDLTPEGEKFIKDLMTRNS